MPRPLLISGAYAFLARELATRLSGKREGKDLAALLAEPASVIVPSRAAADAIVAALLEITPAGIAGVRLRTLETFALDLLNANGRFPRIADDRERRIALEAAAEGAVDDRFRRPSFTVMLERSYRDLRDSGVSVAQFRAAIRNFPRDRDLARGAADVWTAYERKIAAAGAVDPAAIFDEAIALAPAAAIPAQIVFGFYDMTGVQRRLVDVLLRRGLLEGIYVPILLRDDRPAEPYRFSAVYFDHFAESSEVSIALEDPEPARIAIRESATRHDELKRICSDVRRLLDAGRSAHSIGIVTRTVDPRETAVLRRIASTWDFEIRARDAMPLVAHRLGRVLVTLLTIAERDFPRADVLELLTSRLRFKLFGDVDPKSVEFATRRCEIAGGGPDALRRMLPRVEKEHPEDTEAVKSYIAAVERLARLTARYARMTGAGEWADEIAQTAAMFDAEDERDLAALDAVDAIVALLGNAGAMRRTLPTPDVVRIIEQAALPLPAEETVLPEIWFGDVMAFRGRSFDHLFVFGTEQDSFPQLRSEDLLFTNEMRKRVAVREIGDGRDEERLLFRLLVDNAAKEISFSFAGASIEGRPRRPSQLLKEIAIERHPDSRAAILKDFVCWVRERNPAEPLVPSRDEERAARILAGDVSLLTPALLSRLRLVARRGDNSEYDGYLTVTPAVAKKAEERLSRLSATELERFGDCPQRFMLQSIFGIRDIDEPELEIAIELRKKGSLYHRVLEQFYRSLTPHDYDAISASDGTELTPPLSDRLAELVDREFDLHEQLYPSANATIRAMERRVAHRTIRNFLIADLQFTLASGLRPASFEYRFGSSHGAGVPDHDPVPFDFPAGRMTIRGSIDRLDSGAGRFRIIDYKSGTASQLEHLEDDILKGRHLQLALYALVVEKIFGAAPDAIDAYARSITKPSDSDSKFSFRLASVRESLLSTLSTYVDAIVHGHYPALPLDEKVCDFCVAGLWCRTRHAEEERRLLGSMKSVAERLAIATEERR